MSSWWSNHESAVEIDIGNVDALWNTDWGVIQPRHYEALGCYVFHPKPKTPLVPACQGKAKAMTPVEQLVREEVFDGKLCTGRVTVSLLDQLPAPTNGDANSIAFDVAKPAESEENALPSVGAEGHFDGTCKRCTFFPKGRCQNGFDCTFCHYEHDARKRHRRRRTGTQSTAVPDDCAEDAASNVEEERGTIYAVRQNDSCDGKDTADIETAASSSGVQSSDSEAQSAGVQSSFGSDTSGTPCSSPAPPLPPPRPSSTGSKRLHRLRPGLFAEEVHAADEVFGSMAFATDAIDVSEAFATEDAKTVEVAEEEDVKTVEVAEDEDIIGSPTSVVRRARGILNKLTGENFERLYLQLMSLPLQTSEQLSALVFEIFQTATAQRAFLSLYSELCSRIDGYLTEEASEEVGGKAFRRALVNECQASFERNLQTQGPSATKDLPAEERYEAEVKFKAQMLGNMRFIGELLVRRLLASKLLIPILNELLTQGSEAALESLVALLTVVGPHLEKGPPVCAAPLKDAFGALKRRSGDKTISARVRFLFRDLLEARARGWAPKGDA